VVDVDFGGNLAATLRCVRANGSIAIYASNGERTPRVPIGDLMQRNVSLYPMSLPGSPHPARKRAQSDIAQWIASGQRMLSVAARFPLYGATAAHEAVERGDKIGTVVIECAQ
jgi:NADPH2:quinone reductase